MFTRSPAPHFPSPPWDPQIAALETKGIEAILGACRAHPHRPALQEKGCKAMAAITWCQPPAQRRARETGVLKDLITMMNSYPDNRGVQKQARSGVEAAGWGWACREAAFCSGGAVEGLWP